MTEAIYTIADRKASVQMKCYASNNLKKLLLECINDENLNDLTSVLKEKKADNILGYDTKAVSAFVMKMVAKYLNP
jgi:hypothetical protein